MRLVLHYTGLLGYSKGEFSILWGCSDSSEGDAGFEGAGDGFGARGAGVYDQSIKGLSGAGRRRRR